MVYDLTLLGFDEKAQTARLLALTGSGAYLRVVAEDLGAALGVGGYAAHLRRTRIGSLCVANGLSPEELSPGRYAGGGVGVLALEEVLAFLPRCQLDTVQARMAANGSRLRMASKGRFLAYGDEGLLGVYEGWGDVARPVVVFPRCV